MLDKIRERDMDCGVVIPEHWQAQQDRRFLLNLVDRLQYEVAELEHSALKKENKLIRKALIDTHVNYTEVVNENLKIKRKLEEHGIYH